MRSHRGVWLGLCCAVACSAAREGVLIDVVNDAGLRRPDRIVLTWARDDGTVLLRDQAVTVTADGSPVLARVMIETDAGASGRRSVTIRGLAAGALVSEGSAVVSLLNNAIVHVTVKLAAPATRDDGTAPDGGSAIAPDAGAAVDAAASPVDAPAPMDRPAQDLPPARLDVSPPDRAPPPPDAAVDASFTMGEPSVLALDDSGNGNRLFVQEAVLGRAATLRSLSFYVTTAAGKLRLGVYDATGPGGGPGARRAETPEITAVVGWNTAEVTTQAPLAAGTYWLAYFPSDNNLHFRKALPGNFKFVSLAYGAMPPTFPPSPMSGVVHWSLYGTLTP